LVKEQIRIAQGEKLSFSQTGLAINGHAIELRVCAEDPANNFLPETGKLITYIRPQGPGVRVDDGYEQGMDIPIYYDPLIAKLIAWGKDRTEAIIRLQRAIDEYHIRGIQTTLSFGKWAVQQPAFTAGKFDTHFIAKYFHPESLQHPDKAAAKAAAILATQLWKKNREQPLPVNSLPATNESNWKKRKEIR